MSKHSTSLEEVLEHFDTYREYKINEQSEMEVIEEYCKDWRIDYEIRFHPNGSTWAIKRSNRKGKR